MQEASLLEEVQYDLLICDPIALWITQLHQLSQSNPVFFLVAYLQLEDKTEELFGFWDGQVTLQTGIVFIEETTDKAVALFETLVSLLAEAALVHIEHIR